MVAVEVERQESQFLPRLAKLLGYQRAYGDHEHLEGTVGQDESYGMTGVPGGDYVYSRRYPTGSLQMSMLGAYLNPQEWLRDSSCRERLSTLEVQGWPLSDYERAMMLCACDIGRRVRETADSIGKREGAPLFVSPHNLSRDANNITTFNSTGLARAADDIYGGDRFPQGFIPLTVEQYLSALRLEMGDRPLIISLRRGRLDGEGWYMQHPDDRKTKAFIRQLGALKKAGLIVGVDISDREEALAVRDMAPFIDLLRDNGLLYSIHTAELGPEDTALGLRNILEAIKLGVPRIGHAFSLWYLLAACDNHPILENQRDEIGEIAREIELPTGSYKDIALKMLEMIKKNEVSIQMCLSSNLLTCLREMTAEGKIIAQANPEEKFSHHPFLVALEKYGPKIIKYLPRLSFSSDNYTVIGYSPRDQIQRLIWQLLQSSGKSWTLRDIHRFFEQITIEWENAEVV